MDPIVWIIPLLAGLVGVLLGGILVYFTLTSHQLLMDKKQGKQEAKKNQEKEVQLSLLLNGKINEILMKRQRNLPLYVGFDPFKDSFIDIEDYVYLQSFIAQNYSCLPKFVTENFLNEISARKVVLTPDETVEVGGYAFKSGRVVMERLSEDLLQFVADKRKK